MDVLQVAQHADDLDRATSFYSLLLGTEPTAVFDPPGLIFFRVGGVRLLLERGVPSSLIYLSVPDLASTIERLPAGTEVLSEPHLIFRHTDSSLGATSGAEEWHAFIRDSEGNTVGLVSLTAPG